MKQYFKNILITILLFFVCIVLSFSQVPAGYYNNAKNLTGEELRTALFNIIKNHDQVSYNDLWTIFQYTDKQANGKVWDVYSDCDFIFVSGQCGSYTAECDCYNREHLFPQAWYGSSTSLPMYTDLFHLYPTDGTVNGKRGNLPFGEVATATFTSKNGSKIGTARSELGYSGTVFEPADEYKGDFARSYFYMLTRYKDKKLNHTGVMLSDSATFETWAINMLLEWHKNDPVSEKEINRNNTIYNYQKNRNPFIDYANFAEKIWDPNYVDSSVNYNSLSYDNKIHLLPNPAKNIVNVYFDNNDIKILRLEISDISGKSVYIKDIFSKETSINIENLQNGMYFVKIRDNNNIICIEKLIINK